MLAESMGQLGDKLVVQHYVCLNAGESFTADNQQAQHPNIYLRSAEVHFGVVFRDEKKKKKILQSQGCPWAC